MMDSAKARAVMLARMTKEIHGTISPLVSHTAAAAILLRSISKSLPEDKMKPVKDFYKNNVEFEESSMAII